MTKPSRQLLYGSVVFFAILLIAVLGDVGTGAKIDYTAHGEAVNLAARLEALNKDLGTTVCIGPGTAALANTPLRSLGTVDIRSFGPCAVFTLAGPL